MVGHFLNWQKYYTQCYRTISRAHSKWYRI